MTLPEPPLPTVGRLARALFPTPQMKYDPPGHWYATASEALAAAIQALNREVIWFPAYFCNEALRFVRRLPIDLRFYDVQPNLTLNWEALHREMRGQNSSHVVVLVHYFGFPNGAEMAAEFCRERTIALVEDAAHALPGIPGIGYGNATVFSPRKLFAVPGGGILLTDECLSRSLPRPTISDSSGVIGWAARRLMQRMLTAAHIPWHWLRGYRHPTCAEAEVEVAGTVTGFATCSAYVQRLISLSELHKANVIASRRAHYAQLLKRCAKKMQPIFSNLPGGVCPYVFAVRRNNDAQKWVDFLRSEGVPASRWPDLPPEAHDARRFPESVRLAEQTVLLPVHQSLTAAHIEKMARLLMS